MAQVDLASLYDGHYYRTCTGGSYERSDLWLSFFGAVAEGIVREIQPQTCLDVGCAIGLLVEALRDRGVDADGFDVSPYAIEQVRDDVKPYCSVASILDPIPRRYDLITCIEVLEHLPAEAAERAVERLCSATDDIYFSSTPYDYAEDTHLNVRPIEFWAGLFARHGFVRDVDLDPLAIGIPHAVRFRRTTEPLHRVVAGYERRIWALSQENVALRGRALETKALLARHEQELQQALSATPDVAALEQTIAEQTEHLDALNARLTFMSDRESDLRTMLLDAHEQLVLRDEAMAPARRELDERLKVIQTLDDAVKQRTEAVEQLQRVVEERTAWAERMVAEAEARGLIIQQLQAGLDAGRAKEPSPPVVAAEPDFGQALVAVVKASPGGRWARRHRRLVRLYRGVRLIVG